VAHDRLFMTRIPALSLALALLLTSTAGCDGGDCAPSPDFERVAWHGTADDGTAIGCACDCASRATCYDLTRDCPTGSENPIESGESEVLMGGGFLRDGRTYQLSDEQVAELAATCAASEDAACDSGG
jgi:hypothetical protein